MWSTDFTLVFHSILYAGSSAGFHPTVRQHEGDGPCWWLPGQTEPWLW